MIPTAPLLLTLLMCLLVSALSLSEGVRSRIYDMQKWMCGTQFCEQDGSIEPPLCTELTAFIVPENTTGVDPPTFGPPPRRQYRPPCAKCNCMDNCRVYGDCCADKEVGGQFFYDCEEIKGTSDQALMTRYMYVVKHCPTDAPGYTPELADQCDAGESDFSQDGRHVSAPGDFNTSVTFRNKYCALCYNVTDFTPWDVIVSCSSDVDTSNATDMNDLVRLLSESGHCELSYAARHIQSSEICERFNGMVNSCNVTGQWLQYDKDIETACRAYINPIFNYRNIFCALCNGLTEENMVCANVDYVLPYTPPLLVPFSAILNFEKSDLKVLHDQSGSFPVRRIGRQGAHQCRDMDVYDNVTEKCRETYCPLSGGNSSQNCVKLVPNDISVLTSLKMTATYLEDSLIPFGGFFSQLGSAAVMALTPVLQECGFNEYQIENRDYASIYSVGNLRMQFSEIDLVVFQLGTLTYDESKQCLLAKSPFIQNVTTHEITVRTRYEHVVSFEAEEGVLLLPSFSMVGSAPFMPGFNPAQAVTVPISFNESCPFIKFDSDEVTLINDTLIVYNDIELERTSYFKQNGKHYFVCLDDLQPPYTEPYTEGPVRSDSLSAETILTGVCLSCSLLCLLLTLLVYILLRELHTVPGLNLILLTSSLFVAQALYLFGAGAVTTPTICTVLAVLIHYFWLVSFAWMNVCCIHMFRVFNNLFDSMNFADNKCCLVFKYSAFSYGLPACIVGATILTSYFTSESGNIGYGESQLCLVAAGLTSVYSFGVPAGLTVLSNTGLLIYTMVQVRRAKNGYLSVDKNGASDVSKFFKLSTITGVSWVFGFLGYFLQRVELLYVFTVLTAGQGVFIFLSFVVSRRVWGMVKGRCAAGGRGSSGNKYHEARIARGTFASESTDSTHTVTSKM